MVPASRRALGVWTAFTVVLSLVSALQKLPCLRGRADTDTLATTQCYSDAPLFYVGHGLAADFGWLGGLPPGFRDLEYPPLINLFIEAVAKATHVVMRVPADELRLRTTMTPSALYERPGMAAEELVFFLISCLGLLVASLVTTHAIWRTGWRPGDRTTWLLLAPLLVLTLMVNWDAIALAFTALALLAARRSRWLAFGAWVALGTATKLFPLVLLAAAIIVLVRHRRWRDVLTSTASFACVWLLANAPLFIADRDAWTEFWLTNTERPESFGSLWFALRMVGFGTTADQLSLVLAAGMLGIWLVCAALTWRGRLAPTITELSTIFLLTFFTLGKVFSPQYSLWVALALVLVTRNRWVIGSVAAAETFHYVATWLYIRGITTPDVGIDKTYWFSIVLRIGVEVALVLLILWTAARRASRAAQPGVTTVAV